MSFVVRPERPEDRESVRGVHLDAFDTPLEADLVERLREDSAAYIPELSLVVECEGTLLGHCISSRALFDAAKIAVLGPIGVVRSHQRRGVGAALMEATIESARELGFAAIVLIGHPTYYPRFGFVPASRLGLSAPYDVPDDVALALVLDPMAMEGASGLVQYPACFGAHA